MTASTPKSETTPHHPVLLQESLEGVDALVPFAPFPHPRRINEIINRA